MYFILPVMCPRYISDSIGYRQAVPLTHYLLILHPKQNEQTYQLFNSITR